MRDINIRITIQEKFLEAIQKIKNAESGQSAATPHPPKEKL